MSVARLPRVVHLSMHNAADVPEGNVVGLALAFGFGLCPNARYGHERGKGGRERPGNSLRIGVGRRSPAGGAGGEAASTVHEGTLRSATVTLPGRFGSYPPQKCVRCLGAACVWLIAIRKNSLPSMGEIAILIPALSGMDSERCNSAACWKMESKRKKHRRKFCMYRHFRQLAESKAGRTAIPCGTRVFARDC